MFFVHFVAKETTGKLPTIFDLKQFLVVQAVENDHLKHMTARTKYTLFYYHDFLSFLSAQIL